VVGADVDAGTVGIHKVTSPKELETPSRLGFHPHQKVASPDQKIQTS
jgi:hypothetical protein